MSKEAKLFKVEVPVIAHFTVEVFAEDADMALEIANGKPPTLCHCCAPKIRFNSDGVNWEGAEVIE